MDTLTKIVGGIKPLDEKAMKAARERQDMLVKPSGSLGELEDISIRLAGITGKTKNVIDKRILFLFGADNGIYDEGVASSPQKFTNLLMRNYGANNGCAINVLCAQNNVDLKIIDIGVKGELDYTSIENRRLMDGTNNFSTERAMSVETAERAIEIGLLYAKFAYDNGYKIIGNGEVGMGNTTTAAACIMASCKTTDSEAAAGKGAGLTDEAFSRKKRVIRQALEMHKPKQDDALDILSKVGGLDIAAITGLYIGSAYYGLPIVIDGAISIAAALLAYTLNPLAREYMIASHVSEEPAYKLAADKMGLKPLLSLRMRLGEGTGCPIAMGVIDNALAIMNNMSTFDEACLM